MNPLRWLVVSFVFIATGLSFLDRQVLSIAILKIQQDFHITDTQYGWINTSFLLSYALMFTLGGWFIDRAGGKRGLAWSVGIWSVANTLHGFMTNFSQLLAFRFLLGAGEGGAFPGAAKTVYTWFGPKERGLANGIAIGGSAIGAVVAPPLTIWLTNVYGWRSGFVVPGVIGIIWVVLWLFIPWKNTAAPQETAVSRPRISIRQLFRVRPTWVFIFMRFVLDPVMYFMMFWTPKYLSEARGVAYERIGELFWLPFLALGVSNILGGWFSDKLATRTRSMSTARRIVMGVAALLTMLLPMTEWAASVELAVGFMCLYMFAHGLWITNYITAISDVFGAGATSTVVGLSGTAGAISSLILNPMIGKIIESYSYAPLWVASGVLYPIAFLCFIRLIPRLTPVFDPA
ncbi:MFS transporter [Ravibacter arvi]|uniref:MFS transporter n=1 Tax=Ravibacter arvi TaxID=2051041 RepID=A0ABP8M0W4_9BACT